MFSFRTQGQSKNVREWKIFEKWNCTIPLSITIWRHAVYSFRTITKVQFYLGQRFFLLHKTYMLQKLQDFLHSVLSNGHLLQKLVSA